MIQKTTIQNLDKKNSGFTLLELIAVIAIFGILTSIVVGNYSKFTNDVVLTNMAYELALSVREAQVYGVAVNNQGNNSFKDEYGISFSKDQSDYFLFVDNDDDDEYGGNTSCSGVECKKQYTLQRGVKINSLKIGGGGGGCSFPKDKIDILFKRPSPEPIINTNRNVSAQIELISREKTVKYIIVSGSGQIYVTNTPIC